MNFSLKLIKVVTVLILIGLFCWNSTIVFKYFIVGKKVTSYEDKSSQVLVPPAIFICREVAFTNAKFMAKLDDFLDNTLNLNYSMFNKNFVMLSSHGSKNEPTLKTNNETIVNASEPVYKDYFMVEHVYSFSRGLCYKFQFLTKVSITKATTFCKVFI